MVRFVHGARGATPTTVRHMFGIHQRQLYASFREASSDALDLVSPHAGRILSKWRQEVRSLGLNTGSVAPGKTHTFLHVARALRNSHYSAFQQRLQRFGKKLAQRGVKLPELVAAYNRLLELLLSDLIQIHPQPSAMFVALTGMHSLAMSLVLAGYTGIEPPGTLTEEGSAGDVIRQLERSRANGLYEQERRRLSRDLHDQIGHDLVLIKLYLEMIAMEHNQKKPGNVQPRIDEAIALVSQAIDSVRRLVFDLGPAVFEDLGFLPAMRSYARQFSARTKIRVTLEAGRLPEDIPMSHQVALYRLLQGALSNVLKHASAKNVRVSLKFTNRSMLMMVIEDDGVGFDTRARANSFGLTAMHERAEALGGKIEVESRPAKAMAKRHGTTIRVGLPLPQKDKKREPRREKDYSAGV
jgi:signal transduction histidine kinase